MERSTSIDCLVIKKVVTFQWEVVWRSYVLDAFSTTFGHVSTIEQANWRHQNLKHLLVSETKKLIAIFNSIGESHFSNNSPTILWVWRILQRGFSMRPWSSLSKVLTTRMVVQKPCHKLSQIERMVEELLEKCNCP